MDTRTVVFEIKISNVPGILTDDDLQMNIEQAIVDYGEIYCGFDPDAAVSTDEDALPVDETVFYMGENNEIKKVSN